MIGSNIKIVLGAFVTWLVPLVISFGLYDPETKIYLPTYVVFKSIMAIIAAITCFLTLLQLSKTQRLTPSVPAVYVAVNSGLDLALLVGLLNMSLALWATTVLPFYVVIFLVTFWAVKRKIS